MCPPALITESLVAVLAAKAVSVVEMTERPTNRPGEARMRLKRDRLKTRLTIIACIIAICMTAISLTIASRVYRVIALFTLFLHSATEVRARALAHALEIAAVKIPNLRFPPRLSANCVCICKSLFPQHLHRFS